MCGICGILNKKEEKINFEILKKMNETLKRRGPDDEGFYIEDNIGLAMRRLSIIDLEGGKQPIFNEDKSICVIFNGEIYNFVELREELIKKGHFFKTKSDTEVIVHLYEEKGENFPEYLNGMFAIALWDKRKKKLILTRDIAGEKPLYYGDFNDFFIFASELKAILANPLIKREIDLKVLNLYFTLEYVPSPYSIIKNIKKLKPGHTLIYENEKIKIKPYFKFEKKKIEKKDLLDYLDEIISDSVKIRLRSDVPLGIFLSGGIDSSTVTYYARKHSDLVKTFNISFKEPSFDESRFAKKVAFYLKTEHFEEAFDENKMLEILPEVFDFLDEPFADASILPTYLLSKYTRNFVKVALGGDGGDELFGGYPTYFSHKIMEIYKFLPFYLKIFFSFIGKNLPVSYSNFSLDFVVKKFLEGEGFNIWKRHLVWMGAFSEEEKRKLFKDFLYPDSFFNLEEFVENTVSFYPKNLNDLLKFDFKTYLSEDVLFKVDRASMAASLEVRAPFLDKRIIEFAFSIDSDKKLKYFKTKVILKKLMKDRLPPEIIKRGKKGFGIPVAKWIKGPLKGEFMDIIEKEDEILNKKFVKKLFDEHIKGKKDNRKKLWTIYVFLKWKKNYINS
ncbi:MAG: asparagine synthase (glutamine-hydrolyzing) [candidate division WOR-3 bacterium]